MTIITTLRNTISRPEILITGGAGFIGSHLVEALLAEGYWKVVVVDNFNEFYSPEIKRANVAAHFLNPRFSVYEVDIRDTEALRAVFEDNNFTAVVHLAACAGVLPSLQFPGHYFDTNVNGTLNLLQCAKDFGISQFLFGSSSSVYGYGAKVPFSENCKNSQPISPYAASKSAAELLCYTYSHLYAIRCICLRFFTVYGPRQRPDLAIHKFTRLIHQGKPIPMFGDGTSRRDYTYIDDIIDGIRAALDYRGSIYEIFNLGESQTIQLVELIGVLEEALGQKAIIDLREEQAGDMLVTYADVSKANLLLGYKPKTQIREGISKFVAWYLAHGRR
ncbi:Ff.00g086480.m01.CDS01 [Fusarium sp. VM40]|nr:Ff.00g086480.m01.CDS01 [Fusarium sp. VM40]